ncbi:MAG: PP2C family serine/threonine-protein phosphatase [Thermodesulfobacteriota bacterium]
MITFLRTLLSYKKIKLHSFGQTDIGKVRQQNEDSFALRPDQNLYLVADGMGGHKGGEIASRLAIEEVIEAIPLPELRKSRFSPEACRHLLMEAFRRANNSVLSYGDHHPELAGLGCTLVGCLIIGNQAHLCHVGDVRAYLINNDEMSQITSDHSLAAMSEDKEEAHPKNIITRCIGVSMTNSPEYHLRELQSGDQILLCSDGLWNMVDDKDISLIVQTAQTPEIACDKLISKANEAGGRDNITAAILKIE